MKYIGLILLMAASVAAGAENYFVDGAKWIERGASSPEGVDIPFEHVYTIEGTDEWLGEPCLRLYMAESGDESTKHLATVLRVDGDKVYFANSINDEAWTLLYDFGLEIGESCEVGTIPSDWTTNKYVSIDRATCIDKITSEKYGNLPAMVIRTSDDGFEGADGLWLVGIGSDQGVRHNCHYDWCGDAWSELKEMSIGDRIICRLPDEPDNAIDNVSVDSSAPVRFYNLHGVRVERCNAPGVYIKAQGRDVQKIIVK